MKHTEIASNSRQYRARLGISQAELAKRLGYKQAIISAWENGKRQPNASQIIRLAAALGVNPGDLLAPVPQPDPSGEDTTEAPAKVKRTHAKAAPKAAPRTVAEQTGDAAPKKTTRRPRTTPAKEPKTPASTPKKRSRKKTPPKPAAA